MITWDVNPEIFNITILGFNLAPRWYGLAFVAGFLLGEKYVFRFFKKKGFDQKQMSTFVMYLVAGTLIGARLGHCLFYEPGYYLSRPHEILFIWQGGLASHGGFLGVMAAAWLFNRNVRKFDYLWFLDVIAAPSLLTGAFIRIGNLFNSEILGHKTDVAWAFIFKRIDGYPRHPAQLYESFGYFMVSMFIFFLYEKLHEKWPKGRFVGMILVGGMTWRFFMEFFKDNQVAFEESLALNMGQILSLPMILVGFTLIFKDKIFRTKTND